MRFSKNVIFGSQFMNDLTELQASEPDQQLLRQ
jgi:hypothetical protein